MRSMTGLVAGLLLATAAAADTGALLREIAPEPSGPHAGVAGILWAIAADETVAEPFLAAVDARQLALADTLLALLRLPEPRVRQLLPGLYEISDFGDPPGQRPPAWADIRWAGVRWMRRIVDYGPAGRDQRLREELDLAMADVTRPQPARMGGIVEILVLWWADRGLDPALTHHRPPRDPAARTLAAAARAPDPQRPWPGLELLKAMDRDPVVRERVLSRLSPDSTAWLVRDFMLGVELDADSLHAIGVPRRSWDAEARVARGHSVPGLRALALTALDQTAPPVLSGADDLGRRLARLAWWDDARFEARYWGDPHQAPDFSGFLPELEQVAAEEGRDLMRWVRRVHLQPAVTRRRILERLGEAQQPLVAELIGLSALERDAAAAAGFPMVYTRRPLRPAEGHRDVAVAIDFEQVRALLHAMLGSITGVAPPALPEQSPRTPAAWWMDWWAREREDPRWYRGPLPAALELPASRPQLQLQPRRGRVD